MHAAPRIKTTFPADESWTISKPSARSAAPFCTSYTVRLSETRLVARESRRIRRPTAASVHSFDRAASLGGPSFDPSFPRSPWTTSAVRSRGRFDAACAEVKDSLLIRMRRLEVPAACRVCDEETSAESTVDDCRSTQEESKCAAQIVHLS